MIIRSGNSKPGRIPPPGPPAYPPVCPFDGATMVILYRPLTHIKENFPSLLVTCSGLVFLLDSSWGWKVKIISATGLSSSYRTIPLTGTGSGGLSLQPVFSKTRISTVAPANLPTMVHPRISHSSQAPADFRPWGEAHWSRFVVRFRE